MSKKVPLLNRTKDKYKRKLEDDSSIDENVKYDILQRLEGMKNHNKLCHGDFIPSNIIIKENGEYSVIDWAHATQGNSSADIANTFLIFSMHGMQDLANKYVDMYCKKQEKTKLKFKIDSNRVKQSEKLMTKKKKENF